jgi:hypothetical protein
LEFFLLFLALQGTQKCNKKEDKAKDREMAEQEATTVTVSGMCRHRWPFQCFVKCFSRAYSFFLNIYDCYGCFSFVYFSHGDRSLPYFMVILLHMSNGNF